MDSNTIEKNDGMVETQEAAQYETIYFVTEEELASSILTNENGEPIPGERVILINEDGTIMNDENVSIILQSDDIHQTNTDVIVGNNETGASGPCTIFIKNDANAGIHGEDDNISNINADFTPDHLLDPNTGVNCDVTTEEMETEIITVDEYMKDNGAVENDQAVDELLNAENQGEIDTSVPNPDVAADSGASDPLEASDNVEDSTIPGNAPIKKFVNSLTCEYCLKTFSRPCNKLRHLRVIHKVKRSNMSSIKCIECDETFPSVLKLRLHLSDTHSLCMDSEDYEFPNMESFKFWKKNIEQRTLTSYTLRHGARKTPECTKWFYVCHRSGTYHTKVRGPRRRILKAVGSVKLGIFCTAAIYCDEHADKVSVKYFPNHYGHGKDMTYVSLSAQEQLAIRENVNSGIPFQNVLENIRDTKSTKDMHQLQLLSKKDIRFITTAYEMEDYNTGLTEAESVDNFVALCTQLENSPILYYRQEGSTKNSGDFLLILMTEFQKDILMSASRRIMCLDTLNRGRSGRIFLSALYIMDSFDVAFPVAFCLSGKVSQAIVTQFLESVRSVSGPLSFEYLLSDTDSFFYDAWISIMEDYNVKWLWSIWHVDARIKGALKCFRGDIEKRHRFYKSVRDLLLCQNESIFNTMFKNLLSSLSTSDDVKSHELSKYMTQNFGHNTNMWACCFRKPIHLDTNIYLESMHRTFKCLMLESRKHRMDKLIFVLMKLVRYKMLDRLTNLDAESLELALPAIETCHSLGLDIQADSMMSLSDRHWLIRTETAGEENVFVTKLHDDCPDFCSLRCSECDICVHMYTCSCLHSMIDANLCAHIHAVVWKFMTPQIWRTLSPEHCTENLQYTENDEYRQLEVKSQKKAGVPSELVDTVLKRTHQVFRVLQRNKTLLSESCLKEILGRLDDCVYIGSLKEVPKKVNTLEMGVMTDPISANRTMYTGALKDVHKKVNTLEMGVNTDRTDGRKTTVYVGNPSVMTHPFILPDNLKNSVSSAPYFLLVDTPQQLFNEAKRIKRELE